MVVTGVQFSTISANVNKKFLFIWARLFVNYFVPNTSHKRIVVERLIKKNLYKHHVKIHMKNLQIHTIS
jgi:hypothetical protein